MLWLFPHHTTSTAPCAVTCLWSSRFLIVCASQETGHDLLLARISALNLQPLPVVLPLTRNAWLGEKPNWY